MSVDHLKQAMLKAADQGKLQDNEETTQKGVSNLYPAPKGRESGTLNARWGDDPPDPLTLGTSTHREAQDGRGEFIERNFDSPKATAQAEQNLVAQYLEHAGEGNPHSPMLQRGHKTASAETLTDQVRRVVGRV